MRIGQVDKALLEQLSIVDATLWVVVIASALSCFFSLASYSLRAYSRVQLGETFNGTMGRERLDTLERNLAALQLSVSLWRAMANLAVIVGMMFLMDAFTANLPRIIGASAAATGIIAVFGVAIPHAWASCAGRKVLRSTLGVLMFLRYVLYPVTAIMLAFDLPIRRLSGTQESAEDVNESARQEILQAAEEGQAEGAVDREEVEMIESVIEFSDRCADEIMTPRTDIFALPVETSLVQARKRIIQAGHTRGPVYENDLDHIVGVLYAKDMLHAMDASDAGDLRSVMRKPFFVPESKRLDDLLREFKHRRYHMAVVLDEYGGTAGLVTIEDVLEEIVGDISDEYDRREPELVTRISDRAVEVDGRTYIHDLNDEMGIKIPEDEDYDTVAGLVFSELGYIPVVGDTLKAYGATFKVLDADQRKINRLRIELLDADADEKDA